MQTVTALDGDTWESIAEASSVPLSSLLAANGLDPSSCDSPPEAGSTVALPDPPPPVAVAPGEDHSIDSAPESCLWVRLDMGPDEAAYTGDSLRLYDDAGTHDVTLAIADNFTANGDCVDVLFDAVDPNLSYSIDYLTEDGDTMAVIASTPFFELSDDTLPASEDSSPLTEVVDDDGGGDRTLPSSPTDALPAAVASIDLPGFGV